MIINPLLDELEGEQAFYYVAKARAVQERTGKQIISFGIGQPDFDTFHHIKDAAIAAIKEGFTGYTESAGIPELRNAIADFLNRKYNSGLNPDEIVVTTGGKTAIFLAISSLAKRESNVVIIEPSYYAYREVAKFVGAKPILLPLQWNGEDKGFTLDLNKLYDVVDKNTSVIVINNPDNPTGNVFDKNVIEEIFRLAEEYDIAVISDEVYDHFVYDKSFFSITQIPDWKQRAILIQSFSKTFSMTGWRLGYLATNKILASKINTLAVNVYSCAPSFVQKAGIVALKSDMTPTYKMVQEFRERRDLIYRLLKEVPGVETYLPEGTFYIFPRIKKLLDMLEISMSEFIEKLLNEKGVLILPGTSFSKHYGNEFVRLSYATSKEKIVNGIKLLKEFVEERI